MHRELPSYNYNKRPFTSDVGGHLGFLLQIKTLVMNIYGSQFLISAVAMLSVTQLSHTAVVQSHAVLMARLKDVIK